MQYPYIFVFPTYRLYGIETRLEAILTSTYVVYDIKVNYSHLWCKLLNGNISNSLYFPRYHIGSIPFVLVISSLTSTTRELKLSDDEHKSRHTVSVAKVTINHLFYHNDLFLLLIHYVIKVNNIRYIKSFILWRHRPVNGRLVTWYMY